MSTLVINNSYDFSVYANSILGTSYKNAKLISILDYEIALKFENIELLHKQIYPYLPSSTPSDLTKYTYYLFKYNDKLIVLANVWIEESSIILSNVNTYTLKLDNVTTSQLAIIRDQLRLLGISFSII